MKIKAVDYVFILFLLAATGCFRSTGNKEPARIEDRRLVLRLERASTREERTEVALRYGLDTMLMQTIFDRAPESFPDTTGWIIEEAGESFIEISKPLFNKDLSPFGTNDIILFGEEWRTKFNESGENIQKFGTNILKDETAVVVRDSIASFTLTGYDNAEAVYLSGSFNNWSTMDKPMKKELVADPRDEKRKMVRWNTTLKLTPGKYTYRYIVDGKWIVDPQNMTEERQQGRGEISVFFMPSRTFELEGRSNARRVVLTGSFINWSRRGIPMMKSGEKWVLPAYIGNGTWAYKFIADGEWLTDPSNPDLRTDADGNLNSFISIGEKHLFRLNGFPEKKKIILTGTFNNWSENELVMEKDSAGWKLEYVLDRGTWEYKFIADGRWMTDPGNPYSAGSGDYVNSVLVLNANHTFILEDYAGARKVILAGTFNDWSPYGYSMVRDGNKWVFPLNLKPGKHLYKFIVDGKWILDPANDDVEENEYGTGNSVLWIGQ